MKKITIILIILCVPFFVWAGGGKDKSGGSDVGIETGRQTKQEKSLLELAESGDAAGVEKLLKVDIDLDATDDSGRTALHVAAESGDADIAAILLIRGAEVDPIDDTGRTPLLLSVRNRNSEITEMLVRVDADISIRDDEGLSPASVAMGGSTADLKSIITDDNINTPCIDGLPLLHSAALEGKLDHLNAILAEGADTAALSNSGTTALDEALKGIVTIENARCAAALLKAGSPSPSDPDWRYIVEPLSEGDLDARFDYGSTALHVAAENGQEGMVRYLIEAGADIDARDQPGNTPLHVGVRRGYRTIARLLLDLGSDVNIKDFNGNAPIHESLTASDGHAMTSMLLDRGADPNIKNGSGATPLHLCVLLDADVPAARLLLDRGALVDPRDRTGNTPLLLAVEDANRSLAELLLSEGADIFARNNKDLTPAEGALAFGSEVTAWFFVGSRLHETDNEGRGALHMAVALDADIPTLSVLVRAGADTNLRDYNGETPLHYAVRRNDADQATYLITAGSNMFLEDNTGRSPLIYLYDTGAEPTVALLGEHLDTTDRWGATPLFHAIEWEYEDIASALVTAGADAGHRNHQGITPLNVAIRGNDEVMTRMMLDAGSSPDNTDNVGRTPLHDSVAWDSGNLSKMLVEFGAHVDATDNAGQTPLHLASAAGNDEVVSWLLDSGAYINMQDDGGRTALSIAAEENNADTVRLLLESGANLQIRDEDGRTPLHSAVAAGRVDAASRLIAAGSDFFAMDSRGRTPFHLAMQQGADTLDDLMTPALASTQDNRGYTALHIAVESGASADIIEVLISNGVDKRVRNAQGKTAGQMAADLGNDSLATLLL